MHSGRDEGPRPVVTFFQPRSEPEPVLFSLFSGNEVAVRRVLPKSHVSNVIIHDNSSVQRVQEIKLRHLDDSQRKVMGHYEHMKKLFSYEQQNKMNRWKKQYSRYQRMLEKIDQRAMQGTIPTYLLLAAQKPLIQGPKLCLKKK